MLTLPQLWDPKTPMTSPYPIPSKIVMGDMKHITRDYMKQFTVQVGVIITILKGLGGWGTHRNFGGI